jgi:hypothetical protein
MSTERILAISLAAVAAGALPAAPAAAQTIHACVQQQNGDVRIVAPGSACARNQDALQWNQSGPPGPAGPAGPAGPVGPAGPAAPAPELRVEIFATQGIGFATAFCPPDWKVTGGASFAVDGSPMRSSLPIATTDNVIAVGSAAIGWQGIARFDEPRPQVQTYVICARIN